MAEDDQIMSSFCSKWLAKILSSNLLPAAAEPAEIKLADGQTCMEPAVWGPLSMDLLEKVIVYLPFPSLFRGRAVCKQWTTFIFSPKFQKIRADGLSWADLSPQVSYLLVFLSIGCNLTCNAYSPTLDQWLSLPALAGFPSRAKDVVSSDGGLLCFRDMDEDGRASLFVCNPVTQQCQELPAMLVMAEPLLGSAWIFTQLIMDRSTRTYALIVGLYDHEMRAYAEFYSSATNAWTTDSSMPLYKLGVFFNPQNTAFSNNILYCVATERVESGDEISAPLYIRYLVVYEFLGSWKVLRHFKTEKRQLHMSNVHVVECSGVIFMVVGERMDNKIPGLEVTVYLLDPAVENTVEIGRLSEACLTEEWQTSSQLRTYTCVGQGENICLLDLTRVLVLVYNVKQRRWKWLPHCPFTDVEDFHHSSLPNVCRGRKRPKPTGSLLSEVSYQPDTGVFL